MIIIGEAY